MRRGRAYATYSHTVGIDRLRHEGLLGRGEVEGVADLLSDVLVDDKVALLADDTVGTIQELAAEETLVVTHVHLTIGLCDRILTVDETVPQSDRRQTNL